MTNQDMDSLQGVWAVSEMEMEGQTIAGMMLANARIVIKGNRFTSTGMGAVYEGTVTLHDSSNPRQLDMSFDAGPEKGNTNLGIYELNRDTWRICLATRGNMRPSKFAAPSGSGFVVETLKRGEPARPKKTKGSSPRPAAISATGVSTEFEGDWRMVSAIMDGQPMDKSAVEWVRRVTRGNTTTVTAGPQVMMKMDFTSDGSQSPKTIDYVNTAGANKGKAQQGIYELEGGLLRICMSPPGSLRPTQFESIRGDGRTFSVWQRA